MKMTGQKTKAENYLDLSNLSQPRLHMTHLSSATCSFTRILLLFINTFIFSQSWSLLNSSFKEALIKVLPSSFSPIESEPPPNKLLVPGSQVCFLRIQDPSASARSSPIPSCH